MNDFLMRAGLPYRIFVYMAALVVGSAFVLPTPVLYGMVEWWSLYVVPFMVVATWRKGIYRGLPTPALALGIVGCFDTATVLPLCMIVLLVGFSISTALSLLRFGLPATLNRCWALLRRRKPNIPALVTVAVKGMAHDISAADVLRRFGFSEA